MIIVLEGVDYCGKSTTAKVLTDRLCSLGYEAHSMREPGGTPLGEKLRPLLLDQDLAATPEAQTLLFLACRLQLLKDCRPLLDRGVVLVFDRYHWSTVAYQCAGAGVSAHFVKPLFEACNSAIRLGATNEAYSTLIGFHLALSQREADARKAEMGKTSDRYESKDAEFQQRVRSAYYNLDSEWGGCQYGINELRRVNAEKRPTFLVQDILESVDRTLKQHPTVNAVPPHG